MEPSNTGDKGRRVQKDVVIVVVTQQREWGRWRSDVRGGDEIERIHVHVSRKCSDYKCFKYRELHPLIFFYQFMQSNDMCT